MGGCAGCRKVNTYKNPDMPPSHLSDRVGLTVELLDMHFECRGAPLPSTLSLSTLSRPSPHAALLRAGVLPLCPDCHLRASSIRPNDDLSAQEFPESSPKPYESESDDD